MLSTGKKMLASWSAGSTRRFSRLPSLDCMFHLRPLATENTSERKTTDTHVESQPWLLSASTSTSAARTTSAACTACTTLMPSSNSSLERPVDRLPTKAMVMARAELLSLVRVRLGRLRGQVSHRMASRADSHRATLCPRHSS